MAPDIRRAQFEQAGRLAAVRGCAPAPCLMRCRGPSMLMAGLALVAGSLFALRYGLSRRLDLQQPLANFLPESLHRRQARPPGQERAAQSQADSRNARRRQRRVQIRIRKIPASRSPTRKPRRPAKPKPKAIAKMDTKSLPSQKSGEQADNEMASDDADSQGEGAPGKNGEESQDGPAGRRQERPERQAAERREAGFQERQREFQPDEQDEGRLPESALQGQAPAEPARPVAAGQGPEIRRRASRSRAPSRMARTASSRTASSRAMRRKARTARRPRTPRTRSRAKARARAIRSNPANSPAAASAARMAIRPSECRATRRHGQDQRDPGQALRHHQRRSHGGSADHQSATAHALCAEGRAAHPGRQRKSAATKSPWRYSLTCSNTSSRSANSPRSGTAPAAPAVKK